MLAFGQAFDDDLFIEGAHLDAAEEELRRIIDEMFPDTATDTISDWERVFAITPESGATLAQRRAVVSAAYRATGGMTRDYLYAVAQGLGYTQGAAGADDPHVRIVDGEFRPFRAGYGKAGDPVYDGTSGASIYTISVHGTNVETDERLHATLGDIRPAWCDIIYMNE